jgi:transcription initiation factor TFIID TATA-box-binding protein
MYPPLLPEEPALARSAQTYAANVPGVAYISNLVFMSSVGCELNLPTVVKRHPFISYKPSTFPAAFARFTAPSGTCLVSATGKVVITGTKNLYTAMYVFARLTDLLRELYPAARAQMGQLVNLTCKMDVDRCIDLQRLASENPVSCTYTPESFSGVDMKTGIRKISHNVFMSGKIVITGARSPDQALESLRAHFALYERYFVRKGSPHALLIKQQAESVTRNKKKKRRLLPIEGAGDDEIEAIIDAF